MTYTVRIEASEKSASIYIKRKGSGSFTKLGIIPISKTVGQLGFESYRAAIDYDNLKVWNKSKKAVSLDKVQIIAFKGEAEKINVTSNGEEVEFSSSDASVAAVDAQGNINPLKTGSTVITAKGKTSGEQATCSVKVVTPLTAITLCTMERNLYKGDSIEFSAEAVPSDAYNAQLVWKSSDENIIKLYGNAQTERGVKAVNVGDAVLTVASEDGSVSQECIFHVTERPELETTDIEFSMKGISHKIPELKFGVCSSTADSAATFGWTRDNYNKRVAHEDKIIKDIGFNHVKTFAANYDPYKGHSLKQYRLNLKGDYDLFYIEDYINPYKNANVQHIWDANSTIIDSSKLAKGPDLETCFQQIKKLKEAEPDRTLTVVYTCEAYAKAYEDTIPRASDYVEQCKTLSKRIKEELDPNAKFAVTMLNPALFRGIAADPNNWERDEDDLEYTQGQRALDWLVELSKDTSWYDAYDVHNYTAADSNINITADTYLSQCIMKTMYSHRGGYIEFARLLKGKEIWNTEWNDFPYWQYRGVNEERARMENQKNAASVVAVLTQLGEHMTLEDMTVSSFFLMNDAAGFGMTSYDPTTMEEPVYYPYYYALKAAGEVFGKNGRCDYAYPLTVTKGSTYTDIKHMNSDSEPVNTYDAYAYGFGDENTLKEVLITNPNYKTVRVKVTDSKLKKTWEYKPNDFEDPYDGFFTKTQTTLNELTNDDVIKPTYYSDGTYEEYIEIPPYSAVIASVECGTQKDVLSDDINAKLSGSLVLRADSSKAILPDGFVRYIDPANTDVKPATVNDRTMVPLRIGVEAFKDTNVVWNGDEESITVDCLAAKIKMYVDNPTLQCDFDIVNTGDEWTVESDVAPQVINDRTLVPIRVLSETMKKNVFWDEETKLIIIGDESIELTRDELNSISGVLD